MSPTTQKNMYWGNRLADYSSYTIDAFIKWAKTRYGIALSPSDIPRPKSYVWTTWSLSENFINHWIMWRHSI